MEQFTYKITEENGIHARPAGALVNMAKGMNDKITLEFNGKSADAKRLIAVMSLGIKQNDEMIVTVQGENEKQTAEMIKDFLKNNL